MTSAPALCRTILVPLDGSVVAEHVLPRVRALAGPNARVLLLRVLPLPDPTGEETVDVLPEQRRAAREALHSVAGTVRRMSGDLTVEVIVAAGDPVAEISRVASEQGADLIAMTGHGCSPNDGQAFSGVVDGVARATDLPLLIVRPAKDGARPAGGNVRRLVVPLDGSATSMQVLPVARALARQLAVPINLVSVLDAERDAPPAFVYQALASPLLFEELFAGHRLEIQQMLERVGARMMRDGIPATWTVMSGPTASCISELTRLGDLVVMTSHGHTGVRRLPMGSVARALVRRCEAPVILLRARPLDADLVQVVDDVPARAPHWRVDRASVR